ncbi:MAG: hypothetical protein JNM43_20695 [Planctomycetaceae bacterium]|nr:hypothetical protein [Planctomycetaceae bacterium]
MKPSALVRYLIPIVCIAVGAGAAVAVFGTSSRERLRLEEQAKAFAAMPQDKQRVIRLSFEDFRSQSPERQAQVKALYDASSADPQLAKTVSRFYEWWTALPRETAEEFHSLANPERLRMVAEQWAQKAPAVAKDSIVVNFARTPAQRLPELHLSDDDYWKIISSTIPEDERPESLRSELAKLTNDGQRALRLSLWVFETLVDPRDRDSEPLRKAMSRTRRLKEQLLATVKDDAWKKGFQEMYKGVEGRPWEQQWLLPTSYVIVSQAAMSLGNRLQSSFPVSDEQLVAAFDSITDRQQRQQIMALSPDQAKARLEFIAQSQLGESPEKDLLVKFSEFARRHEQLVRAASFGLGGFGRGNRGGPPQPPASPPKQ